jgi:hypothetical protein
MRSKDHLFHLIKSLSKSEKRYFTLDAKKSGRKQSRYLTLFKAINEEEEYTEKPLKKQFGPKLGDDKARLYEVILRSMRDYQSKKSYKTRIKELLTDAKILFERKLYEQAENRLEEAKSLALELEDHLAVLEINLRQRQLIKEYLGKDYRDQVQELIDEKEHHIKYLQEAFWLHDNYDTLSVDFLRYPQRLDQEEIQVIEENYKSILALDPDDLRSFHAKWRLHQFLALFYRLKGDRTQVFNQYLKTVEIWRNYEKLISENFVLYVGDFSNLLSATSRNQDIFDSLPRLLKELKGHDAPNYQGKTLLFERTAIYELIYLLNTPTEPIDDSLVELTQGLKSYDLTPSSHLSIHFNAILLLFLNDRFEACLEWLNSLQPLLKKNTDLRRDIHEGSRIIYLLAVQSSGEFDQTENALRSVNRYFTKLKKSNLSSFHKLISYGIQQLQKSSSRKNEHQILNELKEKITALERPVLAGLDEISLLWIESQLSEKTIKTLRLNKKA